MANNRTNRELETREKTERKKSWQRPEVLPTPNKDDGYDYRWIRVAIQGQDDPTNVSSKLREGWEPVKAADHPELYLASVENDRFKDNVVMGGLMLCRAPSEMLDERREHYKAQTAAQIESVDNNLMRENDPRMPLFHNRKSQVSFGKG